MTLLRYRHPDESWEADQGAPMGVDFDVVIPSSRPGHGPYRVVRHSHTRRVIHTPACEAWRHGHRNCRHVQEAVVRADAPLQAFYDYFNQRTAESAWWAGGEADMNSLIVDLVRKRDEVRGQLELHTERQRRLAEKPPSTDEFIREITREQVR